MRINNLQNLASLLSRFSSQAEESGNAFTRIYQERGNSRSNNDSRTFDPLSRGEERRSERARGRQERPEDDTPVSVDPIVESPPTAPPQTTPTEEAPSETNVVQADTIEDLARLYVQQYQDGSGSTLSDEAFEQKVADVTSFYEGISNGQERLDAVVFANDEETVA